jgi:hypothetical protein
MVSLCESLGVTWFYSSETSVGLQGTSCRKGREKPGAGDEKMNRRIDKEDE